MKNDNDFEWDEFMKGYRAMVSEESGYLLTVMDSYEEGKLNLDEAVEQISNKYMSDQAVRTILTDMPRDNVIEFPKR